MRPQFQPRSRRRELLRVVLAACAVLLIGATLTLLTGRRDDTAGTANEPSEPAPFELPGYRYAGSVDLSLHGVGDLPPFPQGLAFADNELLVVGEVGAMSVLALTRDGELVYENQVAQPPNPADLSEMYASTGDWTRVAQGFGDVLDVATGSDGAVYVSARLAHRVYRIESDGRITTTWDPPLDLAAGLIGVGFIAADAEGNVYYSERDSCTIGVLRPDGSSGALVGLVDNSCSLQFFDLETVGDRVVAAATSSGATPVVPVYDRSGQRLDDIVVSGVPQEMLNPVVLPVRIAIDHQGNFLMVVVSLSGQDEGPQVTVKSLLTVSHTGAVLTVAELPATDLWIDIAVAPDGTLAILYRDGTSIYLFEPDEEESNVTETETPVADAPFELAGYQFDRAIDLGPYGEADRPPFPTGLGFGADGTVYVGDAATMRVLALDRDGALKFDLPIGQPPTPADLVELYERAGGDWSSVGRVFDDRLALTTAPDGTLYLSEVRGLRVYKLAPDGQVVFEWAPQINFDLGLFTTGIITADDAGNVYYAERQSCTIGVLRADGSMGRFGGKEDCSSSWIEDLVVSDDRLYIAAPSEDATEVVIPVFDLNGLIVEPIQARGVPEYPGSGLIFTSRIAVDRDGNFLLVTATLIPREGQPPLTFIRLLTISPAGDVLTAAELPPSNSFVDIAVAPDGTLGILYRDGAEVLLFEPTGL